MSEGKEALGLTEHHQNQIRELLRYNRFKRSERLVGIELCFKDFIETRLYDDETYTQDEVSKYPLRIKVKKVQTFKGVPVVFRSNFENPLLLNR